jgi:hypothetical protein
MEESAQAGWGNSAIEEVGPFMAPVPFRERPSNLGYIPYITKKQKKKKKKKAESHRVDETTAFRTV